MPLPSSLSSSSAALPRPQPARTSLSSTDKADTPPSSSSLSAALPQAQPPRPTKPTPQVRTAPETQLPMSCSLCAAYDSHGSDTPFPLTPSARAPGTGLGPVITLRGGRGSRSSGGGKDITAASPLTIFPPTHLHYNACANEYRSVIHIKIPVPFH